MRRRTVVEFALIVLLAAAVGYVSWPAGKPRPAAPTKPPAAHVRSCAGDRDGDCPAGEPDQD